MKIARDITSDKVREMCIRHDYYTCGDCDEYSIMLANVNFVDPDDVDSMATIAKDIFDHSDVKQFCEDYVCSRGDVYAHIMYNLYNECTETTIEWVVGEIL